MRRSGQPRPSLPYPTALVLRSKSREAKQVAALRGSRPEEGSTGQFWVFSDLWPPLLSFQPAWDVTHFKPREEAAGN